VIGDSTDFRRYLLGELDEPEQEAFERRLMESDEHFQELLIAEDELVDDYCARKLSASQEEKYRRHFLVTPERRRQHRFGVALREHVSAAAEHQPAAPVAERTARRPLPWLPLAAAAVMTLVVAGVWYVLQTQRSPVRLEQTARQVEGSTVAFFLTSGNLRSLPETEQTITIPAAVAFVELQLDLPSDTLGEHAVTIEDARNGEILAEGTLPARTIEGQTVVVATVPSELLAPGDYRVVLRAPSGDAVLGTYEFRVTRQ
jgi:hypothetical protein